MFTWLCLFAKVSLEAVLQRCLNQNNVLLTIFLNQLKAGKLKFDFQMIHSQPYCTMKQFFMKLYFFQFSNLNKHLYDFFFQFKVCPKFHALSVTLMSKGLASKLTIVIFFYEPFYFAISNLENRLSTFQILYLKDRLDH